MRRYYRRGYIRSARIFLQTAYSTCGSFARGHIKIRFGSLHRAVVNKFGFAAVRNQRFRSVAAGNYPLYLYFKLFDGINAILENNVVICVRACRRYGVRARVACFCYRRGQRYLQIVGGISQPACFKTVIIACVHRKINGAGAVLRNCFFAVYRHGDGFAFNGKSTLNKDNIIIIRYRRNAFFNVVFADVAFCADSLNVCAAQSKFG